MVTLLECIERIPGLAQKIIENRKETFRDVLKVVSERETPVNEIVLIGSGTSNTAAVTAHYFTEKASGIRTSVVLPNDFCHGLSVRNKNALYLLISQTGTSIKTMKCLELVKEFGGVAVSVSESADTDLSKAADVFVDMGCGYEEHLTRTIGYSTTVLTVMLLGMELGLQNGTLSEEAYDAYIEQALKAPAGIQEVIGNAMTWMNHSKWQMLRSDVITFAGVNSLYGVSLEGSMKIWELPKMASMGFDLDESMHGPNYGYNSRHCVVVLDDGTTDSDKAVAMARYMKNEFHNGIVIGVHPVDETDLKIEPKSGPFACLEFITALQIMGYRLAEDCGRDLQAPHDNHVMYSYFISHSDYAQK